MEWQHIKPLHRPGRSVFDNPHIMGVFCVFCQQIYELINYSHCNPEYRSVIVIMLKCDIQQAWNILNYLFPSMRATRSLRRWVGASPEKDRETMGLRPREVVMVVGKWFKFQTLHLSWRKWKENSKIFYPHMERDELYVLYFSAVLTRLYRNSTVLYYSWYTTG